MAGMAQIQNNKTSKMAAAKAAEVIRAAAPAKAIGLDTIKMTQTLQSKEIQLELVNADIIPITLCMGTLLGDPLLYKGNKLYTSVLNHMYDNVKLTDNSLVQDFLKSLNSRCLRHSIIVSGFEVIADTTAVGQAQKGNPLQIVSMPLNEQNEGQIKGNSYKAQYTEYDAVQLIDKPIALSEWAGIAYKINAGTSVKINIRIGAVETELMGTIDLA